MIELPVMSGLFGNFEFPEYPFGADDTFEAAARQLIQWRHSIVPGGGIDCNQHL